MADKDKESAKESAKAPASVPVPTTGVIADRDLYLTERNEVVEKGDANARYLLAARGAFIDPVSIQRLRLAVKGGKVAQGAEKDVAEDGVPVDLGTPNEGQLRKPGEPEILVPRTGVSRFEPAPREIHKPGDEVEVNPRLVAVSNVPPEDDKLRLEHYEATKKEGASERAAAGGEADDDAADAGSARRSTARKAGARKRGR